MLIKTSELSGPSLDLAVAKCEGFTIEYDADNSDFWIERTNHTYTGLAPFGYLRDALHFSTDWSQGGPIIERENISILMSGWDDIDNALPVWEAISYFAREAISGPTPLIAAMRCYVASKMGEDVDIPEELK